MGATENPIVLALPWNAEEETIEANMTAIFENAKSFAKTAGFEIRSIGITAGYPSYHVVLTVPDREKAVVFLKEYDMGLEDEDIQARIEAGTI